MTQFLRYAAKSDVGMVRRENEDSGYAGSTLLVVADGMGGHAAGELASATAVATLAELDAGQFATGDVLTALNEAMLTSAERIAHFIEADRSRAGMGTTLTAVLWRGGRIALIHVGDSRAYLLRDGQLSQITHDHTYVQTLIDSGRISEAEARVHPKRNLLLRAIDGTGLPEGETSIREAHVGDRYLLCSDGLCGVVTDPDIEAVLIGVTDPTAAVTELVDRALAAGAPDNVTAVIADVIEIAESELDLESALGFPVVVGAAGDRRNRAALPGLQFPDDVEPAGDDRSSSGAPPGGAAAGQGVPPGGGPGELGSGNPSDGPGAGEASPHLLAAGTISEDVAPGAAGKPITGADADDGTVEHLGWARRHWRGLAMAGALAGALLIGALGFAWWLGAQWFVGTSSGYVAIYQGIPQEVAGLSLNRVTTHTALPVAALPYYDQTQLEGTIDAASEAEAERIVADLAAKAAACASDSAPLGCPLGITGSDPGQGEGGLPGADPSTPATPAPSAGSST